MKKVTVLLMLALAFNLSNAQKKSNTVEEFDLSTTFVETKKLYKANFSVTKSLILKDGSRMFVGDTIHLGPSSSKISNSYETILIGRITLGGALLGVTPVLASTAFERNVYVLEKVKGWRSMGKIGVKLELKDTNAQGLQAKYLTASDYSIIRGELINPNAPLNRNQAIAKLKEAKELFDLDMMSEEDYKSIRLEVLPVIKNN
jgi:hypothetical protein